MNRRKILITAVGVVLLVVTVVASRQMGGDQPNEAEAPTDAGGTAVHVVTVANGPVTTALELTGRVIPAERIDLYAEVNGLASYGTHPFKAGTAFRKGQVLLRMDSRELASRLAAAKSQFMSSVAQVIPDLRLDYPNQAPAWEAYLGQLSSEAALPKLPEVTDQQLRLFLNGRGIYSTYHNLREQETRLSKYTLYAPFTGYLTEANLNEGTLVRANQPLGEFIKAGAFELEASVPYGQLKWVDEGLKLPFRELQTGQEFEGTVVRINDKVDPNTQLVSVYVALNATDLRSGLYLAGQVTTRTYERAYEVPRESVVDQQYVFTVKDGRAAKTAIEILEVTPTHAVVSNLPEGTQLILGSYNSAFEGRSVIVN